jgi:hypothetical protein
MRVDAVRIDGEPAEAFQRESLRASLVRGADNEAFLVVPAQPLEAGRRYQVEFEHQGDVIMEAGNKVYFVGARGTWYPRLGAEFATYDMTFRHPRNLNLVATGELVEERVEGEQRITRRAASSPIRFAGFNLGIYDKATSKAGPYTVEVYANHRAENALQPRAPAVDPLAGNIPPWARPRRSATDTAAIPMPQIPPDPLSRVRQLSADLAGAVEFMSGLLGPLPLKTMTVTPIPGNFGQGFPGLVYLSTVSYLPPEQRPAVYRDPRQTFFYGDLLPPHETAHQWWGNLVTAAGYQDEWIMEAMANYIALMYVEKRRGARTMENTLEQFRRNLLAKTGDGPSIESTGPIAWGSRLARSQAPEAWRTITYDKGAWIVHMLRRRLGEEGFAAMLRDLRRDFEYKPLSTDQFRQAAARHLPPKAGDPKLEEFFEQWVYGTGVPSLKLTWSVKGRAPSLRLTGSVAQSEVDEEFSAWVPVLIQFPRGKQQVEWVRTGSEPASFSIPLKQAPAKVSLVEGSVLSR